MKIAFVTFEYPPHIIGGAGVYAQNVVQELVKLGHEVNVFMPDVKQLDTKIHNPDNLKIRTVKVNNKLPFKALQFWFNIPRAIQKEESKIKFDIVHFNGLSYAFFKKRVSKAPHVLTVHHLVKDTITTCKLDLVSRAINVHGENSLFISYIEKRSIQVADRIISVSNFTKKRITETYGVSPDKIDVIPNGICSCRVEISNEELSLTKKELNVNNTPVLLFVGRINDYRKGLDVLMKAFKTVLEKENAFLLVVGRGNQTQFKKMAESLNVSNNVIFKGYVDDVTLKMYYRLCDIYVCPSRLEGFGLTLLEAMIAGKPIIATNVGAIPEVLDGYGLLVSSDNEVELSNAILEVLANKEKMNTASALKRTSDFSWSTAAEKLSHSFIELKDGARYEKL